MAAFSSVQLPAFFLAIQASTLGMVDSWSLSTTSSGNFSLRLATLGGVSYAQSYRQLEVGNSLLVIELLRLLFNHTARSGSGKEPRDDKAPDSVHLDR